ncbi:PQQ-binding-like beta-propeller repeat protein [Fodinibius salsisoli]|uniref:PQQ-binding-like beta-propeller repeat protein n=1 Tax=Fodinibius salsisoli TaxID=2820877 RepID=A0ABT3PQ47_9BACT|nr:PQQ-binding-like beta-propeller repeat protein [Fodinibius salsisoli]MCW9707955.1 PQQ-binding-like beta-propeller repeat protein [Fodinibius salsisoli]
MKIVDFCRGNVKSYAFPGCIAVLLLLLLIGCQSGEDRNWATYKSDAASSSYSALRQIDKQNVDQLQVAWKYEVGDAEEEAYSTIETNPLVVDDVLYGASPFLKVFALDAATGEELWRFDPFEGERASGYMRSVVYWEDGSDQRILFSAGTNLYALDASTGELITDFGNQGKVDLNVGLGRNPDEISVKASSPGIIHNDLLIMGSAVGEGYNAAPGHIRAYNVRTGEIKWTFHTIPQPGKPGAETWAGGAPDSLQNRGGVNSWAGMSLDTERGIVYIPLGSPVYDFYGGDRKGKNLYGNSLLALNATSGEYIWHYQTVHHDLWDYDLPAPPNLVTVEHDGREIDAVAQVTKTGFTFVFNRETGEPLFPIEEKPFPASSIASEQTWPTQPIPTKPEPFVRQGLHKEDITTRTPEAHDSVQAKLQTYRNEGLFTPPDPKGTVLFPSTRGGANWGGAAYDPESGFLFINANETPEITTVKQVKREPAPGKSLFDRGKNFYLQNCATCHGGDLEGQHPIYPPLTNIAEQRSEEEVIEVIEQGGGMMPAFTNISDAEKEAIITFLYKQGENARADKEGVHQRVAESENEGRYINLTAYSRLEDPDGFPGVTPPWGTLNAINLNTGEIAWRIPLGTEPKLETKNPTGLESWGGPIATAGGLVFIGGTKDKKFRAFDKDSGELLWETTLPTGGFATPSTYMSNDKQYVVIAVGGGRGTRPDDYYVAFTLPD